MLEALTTRREELISGIAQTKKVLLFVKDVVKQRELIDEGQPILDVLRLSPDPIDDETFGDCMRRLQAWHVRCYEAMVESKKREKLT